NVAIVNCRELSHTTRAWANSLQRARHIGFFAVEAISLLEPGLSDSVTDWAWASLCSQEAQSSGLFMLHEKESSAECHSLRRARRSSAVIASRVAIWTIL